LADLDATKRLLQLSVEANAIPESATNLGHISLASCVIFEVILETSPTRVFVSLAIVCSTIPADGILEVRLTSSDILEPNWKASHYSIRNAACIELQIVGKSRRTSVCSILVGKHLVESREVNGGDSDVEV